MTALLATPPSVAADSLAADPPRVLLCAADVGCGHARAAAAVALALRELIPGVRAPVVDALTFAPNWFNRVYRDLFLSVTARAPRFIGWMYDRTDLPGVPGRSSPVGHMEGVALRRFCASEQVRDADLIVCAHFLCARVLSRAKSRGKVTAKLAVVVTDQHPHACWRIKHADLYLVASDAAADELARHGVARGKIAVTGIPIDGRFAEPLPRPLARRKLDLPGDRPVVLITGGGLGLGGIDQAFESFRAAAPHAFAVLVCGRNESLHAAMTARHGASGPRHRILGLTHRMHELMAAADLMIGKPGGLSTSEATAMGLPMILLRPLPGQEERNARALIDAGCGVLCPDPSEAGEVAADLARHPDRLAEMARHAARFGHPDSARAAARAVVDLLGTAAR